jgi:hypothetical protein
MTGRLLTGMAMAVAILFGGAAPAAAYDSNYFEMLRERDGERGVVVGLSFRLGGEREQARPAARWSLGLKGDEADSFDVSAYRFAPAEPLSAPIVFTDEAVRMHEVAAPAPVQIKPESVRLAAAPAKPARAKAVRLNIERTKAERVQLVAAPKAPVQMKKAVLPIDNPHALNRPPTDI